VSEPVFKLKAFPKQKLVKESLKLGLEDDFVEKLITTFGPQVVTMLISWLLNGKLLKAGPGAKAKNSFIKQLFVDVVTTSPDEIVKWIDEGESALYDTLVSVVTTRNNGLAAILDTYKSTILALDDGIEREVLERVINALKGEDA
jgi:hypothetical protein